MIECNSNNFISLTSYSPFGMVTPGRSFAAGSGYRFGFNGKESDAETYGSGNIYDYGFRIYNPRLGKFLSVDPIAKDYPYYSPFHFGGNTPIQAIDLDGLEPQFVINWVTKWMIQNAKMQERTADYIEQKNNINNPINNPDYDYNPDHRAEANNELDAKALKYGTKVADKAIQETIDLASIVPGVETAADAINVVYNYVTGDYSEGNLSLAALIIPGVSGSTLRSLKGAYENLQCTVFSKSFLEKIAPRAKEAGYTVKRYGFTTDIQFGIGYINKESSITQNGYHEVVEVFKDGESYIFDNYYPEGILKSEWEKGFEVVTKEGAMQGSDVWKAAKEIN